MFQALQFASHGLRGVPPALDLRAMRAGRGEYPNEPPINLMRRGPLRNGNRRGDLALAPRCQARCKHDHRPCRQPAMRGRTVCRMHGGKGGAPRGERHGRFRHGMFSQEALELRARFQRESAPLFARVERHIGAMRAAIAEIDAYLKANFELRHEVEVTRRRLSRRRAQTIVTHSWRYVRLEPVSRTANSPPLPLRRESATAFSNFELAGEGFR